MQYKGKTLMFPPRNTKYVPVTVHTPNNSLNMAITDIEAIGDSPYCNIGEDVFLWDYIAQNIKDASVGNMCDLYPDTFKTMTSVPDQLDLGERTSLEEFFSDTPHDVHYEEDGFEGDIQAGDGGCRSLLTAPMMDTSGITNMRCMFGTGSAIELEKENPVTGDTEFKNFEYINACVSMASIPQFDTSNVTNFQGMFHYCENLRDVPELDMSKAENVSYMFQGCTSLPKVFPWTINFDNLVGCNNNDVNKFKGMFEGSSVEEITVTMSGIDDDVNLVFNPGTGDFDDVLTLTPENLDSTGILKKVNVVSPDYDPSQDPDPQYTAEHYLVRVRQDS